MSPLKLKVHLVRMRPKIKQTNPCAHQDAFHLQRKKEIPAAQTHNFHKTDKYPYFGNSFPFAVGIPFYFSFADCFSYISFTDVFFFCLFSFTDCFSVIPDPPLRFRFSDPF